MVKLYLNTREVSFCNPGEKEGTRRRGEEKGVESGCAGTILRENEGPQRERRRSESGYRSDLGAKGRE